MKVVMIHLSHGFSDSFVYVQDFLGNMWCFRKNCVFDDFVTHFRNPLNLHIDIGWDYYLILWRIVSLFIDLI